MNETDQPQKPKRRWIPIVIGIVLFMFIVGLGGIIFSVAWFRQHFNVSEANQAAATQEFDAILAKFPGQRPLLEMRNGEPAFVEERRNEPRSNVQLTTLHMMAWDNDDDELVKFSLPFWLLRMKSGPIGFSSYASGFDRVSLRPEDIERHGPGLVMDFTMNREGRVLVWAE
jgi:hypothetical protein